MLKRKYGDHANWKRVLEKEYTSLFFDDNQFRGHITLLKVHEVSEASYYHYGEKRVCIVDNGYSWLQHFPEGQHYSVTTMFDSEGTIVQWYIDICLQNGVENDVPWMEDLFLDIVVLPTGEVIQKDADELEEAFSAGIINEVLYKLAWNEADRINDLIRNHTFDILGKSKEHFPILQNQLQSLKES